MVLTAIGTCLAWWQDARSQRGAGLLLDEAHSLLGQGTGMRLNYASELHYKQALALYSFSQVTLGADGVEELRSWHLEAALLRLLRLPGMALMRALGIGDGGGGGGGMMGGSAGGWDAIRLRLRAHAQALRTAAQQAGQLPDKPA